MSGRPNHKLLANQVQYKNCLSYYWWPSHNAAMTFGALIVQQLAAPVDPSPALRMEDQQCCGCINDCEIVLSIFVLPCWLLLVRCPPEQALLPAGLLLLCQHPTAGALVAVAQQFAAEQGGKGGGGRTTDEQQPPTS